MQNRPNTKFIPQITAMPGHQAHLLEQREDIRPQGTFKLNGPMHDHPNPRSMPHMPPTALQC